MTSRIGPRRRVVGHIRVAVEALGPRRIRLHHISGQESPSLSVVRSRTQVQIACLVGLFAGVAEGAGCPALAGDAAKGVVTGGPGQAAALVGQAAHRAEAVRQLAVGIYTAMSTMRMAAVYTN